MRAVLLNANGLRFEPDYPQPQPADGEVLVRVLKAGICETDLQLIDGYMRFKGVLGHEFVGIAETGRYRGQRVVGEINCACGKCDLCRWGMENHCPRRTVLGILNRDGAFADYLALPERNLHPVPESLEIDAALFTEPLAAAFQIPAQVPLKPQQRVIVLGDGRLGNLCAQVIALSGCRLTVVGKHPEKLAVLKSLGIEAVPLDEARPQRNADVVVDCTGSPTGLPAALRWVKPRGTIVLKTTVAGEQTLSLAPLVIDEITLIGSRCGPFEQALAAMAEGKIQLRPLISARYPLEDALPAIDRTRSAPGLKTVLEINGEQGQAAV